MKNIPPDIERTLWAIAESNDARAIDEFGTRYPAYKTELVDRIQLVRNLKGSRPHREAPRLTLPHTQARPRFGRGFSLVLAGAAIFTLAIATVVTINSGHPQPVAAKQTANEAVQQVQPLVGEERFEKHVGPTRSDGNETVGESGQVEKHEEVKVPIGPFDKPVHVEHESAQLSSVIREIAQQAKLKIEFAPGFEDQAIAARYTGISARQVLDDLGQNFGFTLMIQEGNRAFIVPAIDPSRPPITVPDGAYSSPMLDLPDTTGKIDRN